MRARDMMPTDPILRRAVAAMLFAALGLAACTSDEQPEAAVAPDTVVARFAPGGEVSVIVVSVSDRRPLRSAELIGPGGTIVPAASIDTGNIALNGDQSLQPPAPPGGAGGFGFGTGAPTVPVPLTGAAPEMTGLSNGQIQSTALLRLPDPLGYRLEWQQWQVRVRIGDPPDVNTVTLPAPQPPANL
jgi:hypothetical protein